MVNNSYYLFTEKELGEIEGFKIVGKSICHITVSTLKRFFSVNSVADEKDMICYEIKSTHSNIETSLIKDGYYYDDACLELNKYIDGKTVFGSPSKRINQLLGKILKKDDSGKEIKILGENGWSSLKELFDIMRHTEYVVLRKHETLPYDYLEGDHDIDILCGSLREMVLLTGAKKRNIGISSYYIEVNGDIVDFDIRFIGDSYLDSQWEKTIIVNRTYRNGISIMDDENQLFSILYHALTQKDEVSNYYMEKIHNMSTKIFGSSIGANNKQLCNILAIYMKSKRYEYQTPKDVFVYQNIKNIKSIKRMLGYNIERFKIQRKIYMKMPNRAKKIISGKYSKKILNLD